MSRNRYSIPREYLNNSIPGEYLGIDIPREYPREHPREMKSMSIKKVYNIFRLPYA